MPAPISGHKRPRISGSTSSPASHASSTSKTKPGPRLSARPTLTLGNARPTLAPAGGRPALSARPTGTAVPQTVRPRPRAPIDMTQIARGLTPARPSSTGRAAYGRSISRTSRTSRPASQRTRGPLPPRPWSNEVPYHATDRGGMAPRGPSAAAPDTWGGPSPSTQPPQQPPTAASAAAAANSTSWGASHGPASTPAPSASPGLPAQVLYKDDARWSTPRNLAGQILDRRPTRADVEAAEAALRDPRLAVAAERYSSTMRAAIERGGQRATLSVRGAPGVGPTPPCFLSDLLSSREPVQVVGSTGTATPRHDWAEAARDEVACGWRPADRSSLPIMNPRAPTRVVMDEQELLYWGYRKASEHVGSPFAP